MCSIDSLTDFSMEINNIIKEQFEKTNELWIEQKLEEKYKNILCIFNNKIKMLVIIW